jgi:hypothetical protein
MPFIVKIYLKFRLVVEGVKERAKFEQAAERHSEQLTQNLHLPESSRRRKGNFNRLYVSVDVKCY